MALPQFNKNQHFSYADYLSWPDDLRCERIDGIPYAMSPAPGTRHQRLSLALSLQFGNFLADKTYKLFVALFDVRLSDRQGLTDEKL